jgi:ferredoxin-type protein NapG
MTARKIPDLDKNRRKFINKTVQAACAVSLGGLIIGLYANSAKARPALALRPPGARPENEFLSRCTRCGICVRDCPYNTLKLATIGENIALGTPYFTARDIPCEMCEDIPCIVNCPTHALDHDLTDIDKSRMGLAVLIDQETCIAFQGMRCEVCYRACPVIDKAITLDYRQSARSGRGAMFIPVVHSEHCTGCGKCEHVCILAEAAIRILPHKLAQGQAGKNQLKGQPGESGKLITPDTQPTDNLPEENNELPFSSNPLDTLNQGLGALK